MQTRKSFPLLILLALGVPPEPSRADAVLDWNRFTLERVVAARWLPPPASRAMAMVHVAVFDAVDAVSAADRRYAPYAYFGAARPEASPEAAAAAAARGVLAYLFPGQQGEIDAAYAGALAAVPEGAAREAGIAVGEEAAAACVARRRRDGAELPESYRPRTVPAVYVPTTLPVSSGWSRVTPWLLERGDQLRPAPPPELRSELWVRDVTEVRELGSRESATRSSAQTESARFWTITGPPAWNPVVRALAASRKASLLENARLFARVSMAAADAFVAVFDAKYAFEFWRPITAIRNGDLDGNEATTRDPSWEPLVETPLHPEYPCAHCITAGAVAEVLEAEFGKGEVAPIEITSAAAPGVVHRWTRIADYVREVDAARVWGGIHYRNSTEVGEAMGRRIGAMAVAQLLRPIE